MTNHIGSVIVLAGLPGSGKTTFTKQFLNARIFSADFFHTRPDGVYDFKPEKTGEAHGWCLREYVNAIHSAAPLILVDNTNTTVAEMAPYCALALAYNYELSIIRFWAKVETAMARNIHKVPESTLQRMAQNMENQRNMLPKWWSVKDRIVA